MKIEDMYEFKRFVDGKTIVSVDNKHWVYLDELISCIDPLRLLDDKKNEEEIDKNEKKHSK